MPKDELERRRSTLDFGQKFEVKRRFSTRGWWVFPAVMIGAGIWYLLVKQILRLI